MEPGRLKVTELQEFLQRVAAAIEQFGQGVGHEELQVMIPGINLLVASAAWVPILLLSISPDRAALVRGPRD
ncbi:MAG: hypothetical protein DMG70_03750 [Acidobacteria bacterium]|nr:MAG: hypothetical protein DMG70_03750 [Acidobacteriota bacterium]PYY06922.1 MAG: hypothetical protein DMG69_21615 [Acidobacteriota bacterium]